MENKKINLAELLKDCPIGMKLYSPIFGNVFLDKIRPHLAIVVTTDKEQGNIKEEFLYDGRYGINEELFLALAALRDDSDYMQWFMSPQTRPKISHGYCGQIVGMDGHYKEIVGYKWYRHENKDNALTERLNAMVQMEAEDMEFEPHKATVEELIEHFKR